MIKVYQSPDEGFGRMCVDEAVKKEHPNLDRSLDYFHFDANVDSLKSLCEEAVTASFSGEEKVILLTGTDFLSRLKRKGGPSKEDVVAFVDYVKNPSPTTALYIYVNGKVIKGECLNALKKTASFLEVSAPADLDFVRVGIALATAQKKTVDREACLLVKERVGGDFRTYLNTLRMLLEYDGNVRREDVAALVSVPLQNNVFGLTDLLLSGQVKKALRLYRDLVRGGTLPLSLLPLLMSQLRFLFEVSYLKGLRLSSSAIAERLSAKPGRVSFCLEKIARVKPSSLLSSMADLSLLEEDVKFRMDDANLRMELYLLSFPRYLSR